MLKKDEDDIVLGGYYDWQEIGTGEYLVQITAIDKLKIETTAVISGGKISLQRADLNTPRPDHVLVPRAKEEVVKRLDQLIQGAKKENERLQVESDANNERIAAYEKALGTLKK